MGTNEQDEQSFMTLRLPDSLHEQIVRMAERNERSTSAEVRIAIREHIKREESQNA